MKILSLILLFPVLLPVCAGCVSEKAPVQGKQENPYRSVFEKGDYIGFQFLCEDKQPYPEIFIRTPGTGALRHEARSRIASGGQDTLCRKCQETMFLQPRNELINISFRLIWKGDGLCFQ